jgi:hypothetical protein
MPQSRGVRFSHPPVHIIGYINEKGIGAFRNKYGYGLRSLVEARISRIKRCLGERLPTQNIAPQENEVVIIGNLVNLWNSFGRCIRAKNAVLRPQQGNSYHPNKAGSTRLVTGSASGLCKRPGANASASRAMWIAARSIASALLRRGEMSLIENAGGRHWVDKRHSRFFKPKFPASS